MGRRAARRYMIGRARKHAGGSPLTAATRLWALACAFLLLMALPASLAFAKEPVSDADKAVEAAAPKSTAPAEEVEDPGVDAPAEEPSTESDKPSNDAEESDEGKGSGASEPTGGKGDASGDEGSADEGQIPPQPGTIKISGIPIDQIPQNQPHQGCVFAIEFSGFEGGGTATATLDLIAPTEGGTTTVSTTLQNDPAGGANDLDAVLVVDLSTIPGFINVPPHPQQGFHVRLDVDVQGVHKSKVFWVEGCLGPQPGLLVFKACPEEAVVGDIITYEVTLQNTGGEDIDITSVVDSLLGDITGEFSDILPAGGQETVSLTFDTGGQDPGTLINTVTATGVGVTSGIDVTDSAECPVTLVPPVVSDIDVSKSCPAAARVGRTIVYEITIANTGDDRLEGISVDDTLLGDVSAFFPDSLLPGGSSTHTFAREILPSDPDPLVNTVTASGTGVESGDTVTDVDSCRTNVLPPLLGVVPPEQPPPFEGDLPVTGLDTSMWVRIMAVLSLSGLGLLYLDRRRSEDAARAYATAEGPVVPGGMLTYGTSSLLGEDAEIPAARDAALGMAMILAVASGLATRKSL